MAEIEHKENAAAAEREKIYKMLCDNIKKYDIETMRKQIVENIDNTVSVTQENSEASR